MDNFTVKFKNGCDDDDDDDDDDDGGTQVLVFNGAS